MTGFDKIVMIAEKEYALAMNEVAHAQAIIESSLELNMQRAELKVLKESGSELDLLYLYEAAGADASNKEQQQGFFSKIGNAIKTAITKVWNAIQKVFTGKDTEAYKALMKAQGKFKLNIPDPTELLNTVEGELTKVNAKGIAMGAGALAASVGAIGFAFHKFKSKENTVTTEADTNKANGWFAAKDRILGLIDNIFKKPENDSANDADQKEGKDVNGNEVTGGAKSWLQKVGDGAKTVVNWITTPIVSGLAKIGVHVGKDNGQVNPSQGNAYDGMKEKDKNQMQQNLANAQGVANTDDNFDESVETKLDRLAAMLEGI